MTDRTDAETLSPLAAAELALLDLEDCQRRARELRTVFDVASAALVASGLCRHPVERRRSHEEDRDNGYGTWWKVTVVSCQLCGAEDHYGR